MVPRLGAQGLDGPEAMGAFLNGAFPAQAPGTGSAWTVMPTFTGLSFAQPLYLAPYPGTNFLLVVEKAGKIWKFNNDPNVTAKTIFLDISAKVFTSSDCALTYFAFHPQFGQAGSPNRGYLYITYKWAPLPYTGNGSEAYWRLSRLTIPDGQTVPDPASEVVLIQQYDRQQFHDSGCLLFGPDGFLYVGIGDEGGTADQYNDGQKINERLFSGILRIDVNQDATKSHALRRQPTQLPLPAGWPNSFTTGYSIPNDNPFVNPAGGKLEEFYAIGLRNPYRFNYDSGTGQIWVADVGQDTREEVDQLAKGANYGWPFREGTVAGPVAAPGVIQGTLTEPIWDYGHTDPAGGGCVIGGYFYHGQAFPSLLGKFIAVDNTSGRIWALTPNGANPPAVQYLASMPSGSVYSGTSSCGIDANGEIYFLKIDGSPNIFYKLTQSAGSTATPPALLSQTGAFSNLATLAPATGVIPYGVNAPLWSDGAVKQRWLALANNGVSPTTAQRIKFAPDAEWGFPAGTVFIKHFELPVDDTNPAVTRRLETRFLVMSSTGEPYGVTYQWRADGSDADLLTSGASQQITINTAGGGSRTQAWSYPSRADCMICHNVNASYVLGVKTHQLNGDFTYPKTGRTANQLQTLSRIRYFDGYAEALRPYFLQSRNLADNTASLETRARSYLDANCSQCHRPNGVRANFDARFVTPLANQGLIAGSILAPFSSSPESPILPGDLTHSVAYFRANRVGTYQMPPLAKNVVDASAMQVLGNWINSLATGPGAQLAAPAAVTGPFAVNVTFSQPVTGLTASGFLVTNGSIASLTGSGASYTLNVTPTGDGDLTVRVLGSTVQNIGGLMNYASTVVHVSANVSASDLALVTWLRLDETTGNFATDSSQYGHNGTIQNGTNASWVAGRFGNALQFATAGEGITLTNVINQTNGLNADDFTISFWIKTTQTFPTTNIGYQGTSIISTDISGNAADFMITGTNNGSGVNRITFQTGHAQWWVGDSPVHGVSNVSTGQWVHIAVTRTVATGLMKVYVNGSLENSAAGGTDRLNANANLTIGTNSPGTAISDFAGTLDQIRLYNRVLSAVEITTLAQDQGVGSVPTPFAQWMALMLPGLTHLQDALLDPDGDGLSNFEEFAFGGNPLSPNTIPLTVTRNGSGPFTLQFRAANAASNIGYTVLASHDLRSWTPVDSSFGNIRFTPITGTSYQWVFGDYTPPGGLPIQPTFFRVQAATAP